MITGTEATGSENPFSALLPSLIGAGIFIYAAKGMYSTRHFIKKEDRIEIDAIVTKKSLVEHDSDTGDTYCYVFKYSINGEQFKTEYMTGHSKSEVGYLIRIYCHKENPEEIILPIEIEHSIVYAVIFLIIAILFVIGGVWVGMTRFI
jgi:hypothetical protein